MERCGWCGKILMPGLELYFIPAGVALHVFCNIDCFKAWDENERRVYPGYKPKPKLPSESKYPADVSSTGPPSPLIKIKTGHGKNCPARPQLPKIECKDLDDIYCE